MPVSHKAGSIEPDEAMILGVDTTGLADSVALLQGDELLATLTVRQPTASSRPLLRLIDAICAQAGCGLDAVAALAVNVGPGAFTGLRVGLATVQGLALAYGKPVVGCSAFEALAILAPLGRDLICPVVQARKGEVYAAVYRREDEKLTVEIEGMVATPEAVCTTLSDHVTPLADAASIVLLGSGVAAYRDAWSAGLGVGAMCLELPQADAGLALSVARVGRRFLAAGVAALPPPQPLYIRQADARLPRIAANAAGVTLL